MSINTQTHVYQHTEDELTKVICIYCHLPHAYNTTLLPVALSGKHIVTCHLLILPHTQTHVYLHTGDELTKFICIYCHLSHAYNTTLLSVVLLGKYIVTCHLLILPQYRLTSISTQEIYSEHSYVYIVTCHMHLILHYCPSSCICK